MHSQHGAIHRRGRKRREGRRGRRKKGTPTLLPSPRRRRRRPIRRRLPSSDTVRGTSSTCGGVAVFESCMLTMRMKRVCALLRKAQASTVLLRHLIAGAGHSEVGRNWTAVGARYLFCVQRELRGPFFSSWRSCGTSGATWRYSRGTVERRAEDKTETRDVVFWWSCEPNGAE
jgi:hypothetical protein